MRMTVLKQTALLADFFFGVPIYLKPALFYIMLPSICRSFRVSSFILFIITSICAHIDTVMHEIPHNVLFSGAIAN